MCAKKGSITVFSLLSLLLVTATLFSVLEGTRYMELQRAAESQTELAMEAVFADYETVLWKNYRLLGSPKSTYKETMEHVANARVETGSSKGANFLMFEAEQIELISYRLLTDGKGKGLIKNASRYMSENIVYETLKEIKNHYDSIRELLESSGIEMEYLDAALYEIRNLTEAGNNKSAANHTSDTRDESIGSSGQATILDRVKQWMANVALEFFLEDTDSLSECKIDTKQDIFSRELAEGTEPIVEEITWLDRVLFQQYLLTYLSNYQSQKSGRALVYEVEYLLGQKASDVENLLVVCEKILAIREAANLVYLTSDLEKVQQAQNLAMSLAGASANAASINPAVIETIRWGILAAWAFGESVLDVRALLAGKKVPFMKSAETWTLQLENIGEVGQGFQMAKECESGIGYEMYVGVLLLIESGENVAMRTLNLQEATIRKAKKDETYQIDSLLVWAKGEMEYTYTPIFPFLGVLNTQEQWEYKLCARKEYGYY